MIEVMTGMGVLDEHDCLLLLRDRYFGRVALSSGALPVVFPIHYSLLGRDPVFRTGPGSKLDAAGAGQILCLEIDDLDPMSHSGWSVNVTGPSEVLTDPDDLAAARRLPLRPWVGTGDTYVRINATMISGRRIDTPADARGGTRGP